MSLSPRQHAASSALLGAAVVLVGCDEGVPDAVDGQFELNQTDAAELDPNEAPTSAAAQAASEDGARLNDTTPETDGKTEYDSEPLVPGEADD